MWARPLYRFYPLPGPIYISKTWGEGGGLQAVELEGYNDHI